MVCRPIYWLSPEQRKLVGSLCVRTSGGKGGRRGLERPAYRGCCRMRKAEVGERMRSHWLPACRSAHGQQQPPSPRRQLPNQNKLPLTTAKTSFFPWERTERITFVSKKQITLPFLGLVVIRTASKKTRLMPYSSKTLFSSPCRA